MREVFLQQNAYHAVDAYCPLKTQALLLRTILLFHERAGEALRRGAKLADLSGLASLTTLARSRFEKERDEILTQLQTQLPQEIEALAKPVAAAAGQGERS